ncbi:MAG: Rid family detoxifying hydrolase [Micrococcales bacterium]|nr:Rid family detoxifying hydrolase [Micrococcales bacterium]
MSRIAVHTDAAPQPSGAYSQAIRAGNLIWTAGLTPVDPATGLVAQTVAEQTRQVLRNLSAILQAANSSLDDVVKTTVHLADMADFAEFNTAYAEFFTVPGPARTTVGSQLAGIKVEIDVVATCAA